MAILGSIIKGVINLSDTLTSEVNHVKAQQEVLKELLETAKQTQFGQTYSFNTFLLSAAIAKQFALRNEIIKTKKKAYA